MSEKNKGVFVHREIIEKCKEGNSTAQYKLYKLYSEAMFNVCYRIMSNREEAEDILQEAFIDAFSHLDSFRYESSFGTWLKRNVINKCLNEIRRSKPELMFCDDMSYFQRCEDCHDEYARGLTKDIIVEAMETLPKGAKLVFSLYLLEGYDHQEIAQILNISVSSSKTQFMRAKRKLKAVLTTMMDKEDSVDMKWSLPSFGRAALSNTLNSNICMQAV